MDVLWIAVTGGALGTMFAMGWALRGGSVPAWAALAGPLVVLAGARRSFVTFTPDLMAPEIAAAVEHVVPVGTVYVLGGALAWFVGWGAARTSRGYGAPALSQVGGLAVAFGLVWRAWAAGEAALWRASNAEPVVLEALRAEHAASFEQAAWLAVAALALLWLPAAVWGFLRDGWPHLGDSVAAAVLALLILTTGQPARDAVQGTYTAWTETCHLTAEVGPRRVPGHLPVRGRVPVRDGEWGMEHWADGRWKPGPPDGAAVWIDQGEPPAELRDVVLAGYVAAPTPPRNFDRHPAVVASRCRGRRPSTARGGTP